MKFIKRWYFLLLIVVIGVFYLSQVDRWQIYTKPLSGFVRLCRNLVEGEAKDSPTKFSESDGTNSKSEEGSDVTKNPVAGNHEGDSTPETGQDSEELSMETESGQDQDGALITDGANPEQTTPSYTTVEDDYFKDAVFIGDSRTVGLFEYGNLEETATFYASTGLSIFKLMDARIAQLPGDKRMISVREALQETTFSKIYLMLGINEMGTGTANTFADKYAEIVEELKELQPEAIIYIQGIMKVTTDRSNQGDYINNEGIEERNSLLQKLADNQRVFYLDVNPILVDETGGMVDSYTFDGVHLKAQYIDLWKNYLKSHAISP